MNRPFVIRLLFVALLLVLSSASMSQTTDTALRNARRNLMPVPSSVVWNDQRLPVTKNFKVAVQGQTDARLRNYVSRVVRRLEGRTVLEMPRDFATGVNDATLVVETRSTGNAIPKLRDDESYELTISSTQAKISAPTTVGAMRGLETFLQLLEGDSTGFYFPGVSISDRPRFPWRGLMIDSARHFQPLEVMKRTLDGMSAVKLNVLHWHLTEDQGFRVESKRFPRLHERGSDGKYYTHEQVKEVIAYARDRGIRVMPEFDMPGHTTSWLVGHPELGSSPGPFQIVRTWGIFDEALDPTRDEVYTFLDGFHGEMAALFPDAYLHIGGDEVNGRSWNQNPRIQDFMYRNQIRDNHDLQAAFNKRVYEIVKRHGKRMVGWDEVLHPDLPKDIMVESWRGPAALADAARLGYDGILANGYYLDLNLSTASHYLSDPIPPGSDLPEEARRHVLGGEACMWAEFVSPATIDSRLWPRA